MTAARAAGTLRMERSDFPDRDAYLRAQARAIRRWIVAISAHAQTGHVGSGLSIVDMLTVLYFHAMRVDPREPQWPDRDRFILSKGHAASALYATLAAKGFIPAEDLWSYLGDDSALMAHVSPLVPGVELATGSLGHGLPVATGLALAAARRAATWRTFVMLSDGECQEGSTWESLLSASHLHLDNLVVLVDQNNMQALGAVSDVLPLEPLAAKFASFGWAVASIDGHDINAAAAVLDRLPLQPHRPTAILMQTVIGKGVSFMEGRVEWHYLAPTAEQAARAFEELV